MNGRGVGFATRLVLLAVALTAVAPAARAAIYLRLQTPTAAVAPGDTIVVQAAIVTEDSLFNAFDLVVRFDPARVTFVPVTPIAGQVGPLMSSACGNVFHRFTPYADSVVANLSLLCAQTFVGGPGVIYQLRFRAGAGVGPTSFTVGARTRFYNAGVYVTPIEHEDLTMLIGNVLEAPGPLRREWGDALETPRPNPAHAPAVTTVAFTLATASEVALELFDMQGRRVAVHGAGMAPAGRSAVRWALPALAAGRYELRLRAHGKVAGRAPWVVLR